MGCTAAKNMVVEPLGNTKVIHLSNGMDASRKLSTPKKVSDLPALVGVDPQTEYLESGPLNNVHQTQNGLSFDISFENEDESIIRKHPPKRFQKLEDDQISSPLSIDRLQEKLDEAEVRRQQILQNRIQSAQLRKVLKKPLTVDSIQEDEIDYLQVPDDKPNTPFLKNPPGDQPNTVIVTT
ncbi:hypothetical protein PPYR_10931 [Photinus pyralis]|uniref:Uncharacterized protein n=2 Tax=Photinus pyralis TaxID=7054 RepID=A0A5N4AHN5_PHOPY|nr:uncharacterized protein LOC116175074 [Photinus pyralis]KAB0796870.1 hypothetical protein PPYR_10931 [Photinus pyralis]